MGSFSWLKADNLKKTANIVSGASFRFLIPAAFGGGSIKEHYQDYGQPGDKENRFGYHTYWYDMYELLAFWNADHPYKEEKLVKRNIKDTVFTNLFSYPKYILQLYQCLHPEETEVTVDQIKNVTLKPVITNAIYNDLGFMVGDRLLLLVEAQSSWSENIAVRCFLYLAQTYKEYLECPEFPQSVYSSNKISIPKPELYMIYTGNSQKSKNEIRLSEEFFGGDDSCVEAKVKILYDGVNGDILWQYVAFTRVVIDVFRRCGRTQEAAEEIFRICREKEILQEYLNKKELEVRNIMIELFDDEQIQKSFIASIKHDSKQEGIEQGIEKDKIDTVKRLLGKNLPAELVSEYADYPVDKVRKLAESIKKEQS